VRGRPLWRARPSRVPGIRLRPPASVRKALENDYRRARLHARDKRARATFINRGDQSPPADACCLSTFSVSIAATPMRRVYARSAFIIRRHWFAECIRLASIRCTLGRSSSLCAPPLAAMSKRALRIARCTQFRRTRVPSDEPLLIVAAICVSLICLCIAHNAAFETIGRNLGFNENFTEDTPQSYTRQEIWVKGMLQSEGRYAPFWIQRAYPFYE